MEEKKFKTGAAIIIIGRQGSGKSPLAKSLGKQYNGKNKIVYDPRSEYNAKEYTIFKEVEYFQQYVLNVTDSFVIVEEATGFLNSFRNSNIDEWLIGVQHKRNIILFLFHSVLETPQYIFRKSQYTILLQLNKFDSPEKIRLARPEIYEHLNRKRPTFIDNYG